MTADLAIALQGALWMGIAVWTVLELREIRRRLSVAETENRVVCELAKMMLKRQLCGCTERKPDAP